MKVWCESCKGKATEEGMFHCSKNMVITPVACKVCEGKGYTEIKSMKLLRSTLAEALWIKNCPNVENMDVACFTKSDELTCVQCWEKALKAVDVIELIDDEVVE